VDGRRAAHRGGTAFVALSTLVAGVVGIVLGGIVGGALYEPFGPPWAQFGADFEGFGWVLQGALSGGAASMLVAGLVARAVRRNPRGRRLVGAVLGGALLGTAGGLSTFLATARRWVVPVLFVAVVGAVVGAVGGARVAVAGMTPKERQ
jgi:hypothetical protein